MITIECDKMSEFLWIKTIIDAGVLNCFDNMKFLVNNYGIEKNQTVNFKKSDQFINDVEMEE